MTSANKPERPDRQPGHPNLKRSQKGQAPPTAGKAGGNGAWTKARAAKQAKKILIEKARARGVHVLAEKGTFDQLLMLDLTPAGRLERQKAFLEAMVELGTVSAGCRAAGVSRTMYYKWIEDHPEFKEACEVALQYHVDDLEAEASKRAKSKSDILMIFLLKRHRPEFRDSHQVPGASGASNGKVEEEEQQAAASEVVKSRLESLRKRSKPEVKALPPTSPDEFDSDDSDI